MQDRWKKYIRPVRIVAGVILLILGVLGLFLPILQGILFLILGGMLLGRDTKLGRWINDKIRIFVRMRRKKRIEKKSVKQNQE